MARPQKQGLEYFPLDVDFLEDEKVLPISVQFGAKGEMILIRLLCAIYRQGYFAKWSEAMKFKIANQANCSENLVSDVVANLVRFHFFDEKLFNNSNILTSRGIQERWKEATKRRKEIALDYWVLDPEIQEPTLTDTETELMYTETQLMSTESTQSKGKETKGKETKVSIPPIPPRGKKTKKEIAFEKSIAFLKAVFVEIFRVEPDGDPTYGDLWKLIIEHQEVKLNKGTKNVWTTEKGPRRYINDLIEYANKDLEVAKKVVLQSIEKEWISLVELKVTYGKHANKEGQFGLDDYQTARNLIREGLNQS